MVDHAAPAGRSPRRSRGWTPPSRSAPRSEPRPRAPSPRPPAQAAAFAVAGAAGTVAALVAALRARPLDVPGYPAAAPAAA
jgi:hypothetical protein